MPELMLLRRPKFCVRRGSRVQLSSQTGGRMGKQAVCPDCVSQSRMSRYRCAAMEAERVRTGVLPTIQGRGSKGYRCRAANTTRHLMCGKQGALSVLSPQSVDIVGQEREGGKPLSVMSLRPAP
jgi:hypothetical protein